MDQGPKLTLIVRPDGTVPFDPPVYDEEGRHVGGVHPDVKRQVLGYLAESGHQFHHAEDGSHVKLTPDSHDKFKAQHAPKHPK